MHSEMDVPRPRINNIKTMEQKQEHKNSNIMTSFLISHLPKSSTLTLHQKGTLFTLKNVSQPYSSIFQRAVVPHLSTMRNTKIGVGKREKGKTFPLLLYTSQNNACGARAWCALLQQLFLAL